MIQLERAFNMDKVSKYIDRRIGERTNEIVDFLRVKGMEYTRLARQKAFASVNKAYTNRTWNLVSSVGFGIAKSGLIVESFFPVLRTGSEGSAKGEKVAEKAAKELCGADEIALVLVAGEDYASFVQSKGYDVIANTSDEFQAYIISKWRGYI